MLTLREATTDDASLISRLIATSWRGTYQGLIDPVYLARLPEEYWLPSMRAWLSSGRMYGYIAEVNGEAVGCVVYGRGRDEDHADWGEIVSLYILPEMIGQGVGSRLLKAAMDSLREDGYAKVYLWAIEGFAPADSFYQRRGFVRTGDQAYYKLGQRQMTDVRYILEG